MVREIMHDKKFLSQKAEPSTKDDMETAQDLADTLICYRYKCVGLAANMIGVNKAIIAIKPEEATEVLLMFNPKIVKKSATNHINFSYHMLQPFYLNAFAIIVSISLSEITI